jgi:hypothetical protein
MLSRRCPVPASPHAFPGHPRRRCTGFVRIIAIVALALLPASAAARPAAAHAPARASAKHAAPRHHRAHHGPRHGPRHGGKVRRAWPRSGRAPHNRLNRWLAHQVGAAKPRTCAKRWRQARRRCHLHGLHHLRGRRHALATMSAVLGDPGSPPGSVARIASSGRPRAGLLARASATGSIALPLQLVRSYEIPADDPSYNGLLNWSWTYDSAVAAAAFASAGDKANATQLLDQLAALQHADGSIELAFNTATGDAAPIFRSGTIAWAGLAAAAYDQAFGTTRFLGFQRRDADYLLSLVTSSGLIKGGPDVGWASTEHNLSAYTFLVRLAGEEQSAGNASAAARYGAAAVALSKAIDANLLIADASGARFRQGLGDDTPALDAQALGAMYLQGTGRSALAAQVLAYGEKTFAVDRRAITVSKDPAAYNLTYAASGPFSGYAPYAGTNAPDVRWAEGSGEMREAQAALGQDTSANDKSIAEWAAITESLKQGPLQADRTVRSKAFDVEYHVWPASTAAAWTVLAQSAPAFFAAPLPPSAALVTDWTKVRGGNLITTFPDGRVEMLAGAGERRVLATGSSGATDYTVTSNATLLSGTGYGVYVRATVDAGTKLTGYCIQYDHAYGQLVVRELQSDFEVSTPLARANVPTGFVWYAVPHTVAVTVKGNAMSVALDGAPTISIPDLAAASATAVKSSYNVTTTITPPTSGGWGLRAWADSLVSLQQMTVQSG